MQPSMLRLIALLPLIRALQAQFLTEEQARLQAWRAYGSIVQQSLTAGVPLTPGKDMIFVTPPNLASIRGGSPVPDEVTNFDLYNLCNPLQNISEPLLDPTGLSYVNVLSEYLDSVDIKIGSPTAAQQQKLDQLAAKLVAAQDKFDEQSAKSQARWIADARAQAAGVSFGSWVVKNDPLYARYQSEKQGAYAALAQYEISIYGPQAKTIQDQRDKLSVQAKEESYAEPGYNMPTYVGNWNTQISPWTVASLPPASPVVYKPLYTLAGGFEETMDRWLNGSVTSTASYAWRLQSSGSSDWSSLGHTSTVTNVGGSYWGLLSASYGTGTQTTTFNGWTSSWSNSISMTLTMKGGPQIFTINAGYWDVGGVRQAYPRLTASGVDQLRGRVRLTRLLVAYEVGMTITISDAALYRSVSTFIQTAQRAAGGGFRLFGFAFGANKGSQSYRSTSSISMTQTAAGGQIVIPPSPPGVTYMLGALGTAL